MKKEKRVHAGALALFQLAQQRCLAAGFAQGGVHHVRPPAPRRSSPGTRRRRTPDREMRRHRPPAPSRGRPSAASRRNSCRSTRTSLPISSACLQAAPQTRDCFCRVAMQKIDRAAFALLEVVGPADRAHAHHPIGQRNHPHPAMLEAVDADVARVRTRRAVRHRESGRRSLRFGVRRSCAAVSSSRTGRYRGRWHRPRNAPEHGSCGRHRCAHRAA